MTHPAIHAVQNLREEMNARLARVGQTAVQELLQPLWESSVPIAAISWDQAVDMATGAFFSTHRIPRLLVDKTLTQKAYDLGRNVDPTKIIGVLGSGWTEPKDLIPATRKVFNEKIADFVSVPNDIMLLTFRDDVTITVHASGQITTEKF